MLGRRQERVRFEARPHGVVLAPALARAVVVAGCGVGLTESGWPWTLPGAFLLAVGALIALAAVWTWERTRLVLTSERLIVRRGTLRRARADVPLARIGAVEVEQGFLGRLFGYGTVVVGDLEVPYVSDPRTVSRLATRAPS